ncbi:MAG: peptidase M66, partial [Plesiomonas shigelloides]
MEMSYLSCLIAASLVTAALPVSANDTSPLYFNSIQPKNDLVGKLEAKVQFAQSQILPSKALEGDRQPILTSLRKSLILVQPLQPDAVTPMFVDARDSSGALLGTVTLAPPSALPETVYHLPGVPAGGVNFTPESGETRVINSSAELAKLDDKNGAFLKERLATSGLVEIQTAD